MSDIGEWFKSVPLFTRYWFALSIGFSLVARLGIVNPYYLYLVPDLFIQKFQIWRPVTAVFYYPMSPPGVGFHFLSNLYFLYHYSRNLETGLFDGRPADYCFMLVFCWLCSLVVSMLADLLLLMDQMVMCVLYVWCQLNKDVIVSFWFGTQFKAVYLPWVLVGVYFIMGRGGLQELIGILVGHLYFFLMFKYPQEMGGPSLLSTPSILYKYFPSTRSGIHGFGQAPTPRRPLGDDAAGGGGRHNWGRGYTLR
ncbi:derlin-1 [Bacillus rossius redtenbacheri]|uniref:derlin-1 n=1 Tax=Bacillus rossius redtenbacheri TaxID=93214 RepID=UPI002FDECF21